MCASKPNNQTNNQTNKQTNKQASMMRGHPLRLSMASCSTPKPFSVSSISRCSTLKPQLQRQQLQRQLHSVVMNHHHGQRRLTTTRTSSCTPNTNISKPMTSASGDDRPFRVLGLQQVALGGLSKSNLADLWCNLFGVPKVLSFKSEKENVDEDVLRLGEGPHAVEIDLMQPIDPNKSPKVHDPPLNHIGLWVDNLPKAVEYLTKQGVRFTPGGIRKGASGYDITFIHPKGNDTAPKSGAGVLIELVQAPPEVIEALSPKKN